MFFKTGKGIAKQTPCCTGADQRDMQPWHTYREGGWGAPGLSKTSICMSRASSRFNNSPALLGVDFSQIFNP